MSKDVSGQINVMEFPTRVSSAFDVEAFDEAIEAHGVRFVHYRGMRNPVGLIDKFDSRRPDTDHSAASNGMLYTKAGCITALFTSNSKDLKAIEGGYLNSATAQITPTRFYSSPPGAPKVPIYLHPMDRLYLEEESVMVTHQQLVDAHETGVDDLKFPALHVLDLVDASGIRYTEGSDFALVNGSVKWCGQRRPGINPETGKGRVYAVRFLYRPFWYIDRLMHEIRVAQYEHPITGERGTVRMQQSAMVQREYVFDAEKNDDEAPASPRQAKAPESGGFGPR